MKSFQWSFDTNIIFGKNSEDRVGEECSKYSNRILILCNNSKYIKDSNLIGRVKKSLDKSKVKYLELSGIVPNPTIDKVREGIELCKKNDIDFILAIGGGSIIDTAKSIAAGVPYNDDVWKLFSEKIEIKQALPVGVILTIAAAGSEGSTGAVITNPETNSKFNIVSTILRPKFAILNPETTLSLPEYQTSCGVVDILAHSMERYFTDTTNVELTDRLGEAVMKTVIHNGLILHEDPYNYAARSEIMLAGTLAHNGLLDNGRDSCWASHIIAMEISAHYNSIHGATLSVIIPAWMSYIYKNDIPRFAMFANKVLNIEYDVVNPESTARHGISALKNFFSSIGMPTSMEELGITDMELFDKMAKQATRYGSIGCIQKLNRDDVRKIFELASLK